MSPSFQFQKTGMCFNGVFPKAIDGLTFMFLIRIKSLSFAKMTRVLRQVVRCVKLCEGANQLQELRWFMVKLSKKSFTSLTNNHPLRCRNFSQITGLNRYMASRKIVRLVLANVLKITATDKGDVFSRV